MNRTVIALAAAAALTIGLAGPAAAAPPTPSAPGPTQPVPALPTWYYTNSSAKLPSCKSMGRAPILLASASTFTPLGDLSNILTHAGYGTQLSTAHAIIEDGGYSCTWQLAPKKTFTISISRISPADRTTITSLYLSQFGSTGTSVGGTNMYFSGYTGSIHEVGFLLDEGVWVTGKVTDDGDYFPAVLQDISDMVYSLNH
jgi:hypothetical protein